MNELKDRIQKLQNSSSSLLEPDANMRREWLQQVQWYAEEFLERTDTGAAYEHLDSSAALEVGGMEESGIGMERLLEIFEEAVEKPGINPASGGHLGYIPGGGLYSGALGDFLAAVTNRYAGIYFANPGAVRMEQQMVDWMKKILGMPEDATGNLSSGGSVATLTAVTAARDSRKIRGAAVSKSVVYSTTQAHHCLHKALRIAGLGEAHHRAVSPDKSFKMPVDQLEKTIVEDRKKGLNPFLVVSSAGTTDSGVVDPLLEIDEVCKKYGLWHHVDAAYGGFFVLVEKLKPLFSGLEKADSIVIDPHKGLFLPYGIGAVLIRDLDAVLQSHHYQAGYMRDAYSANNPLSPADISPELTRHFRGLRMWLSLKLSGVDCFRKALEEKHLLALYFWEKIKSLDFETADPPELSVVLFRYTRGLETAEINAFNQKLIAACHRDGRVFLSSTTIDGKVWLRCAILSFRTHLKTIDQALLMLTEQLKMLQSK